MVLPAGTSVASVFGGDGLVINWGDGTTSNGSLAPFRGALAVVGTHRYAVRGVYHTTISFTGPGGPLNTTHGTITAG